MNLAICVPARETVNTGFSYDLAMLCARFFGNASQGTKINLNFRAGTLIADQRQKLVEMSLQQGATHILFLDSDMRFPQDLLERLLAHDKDVVACNYSTRRLPAKSVAWSDFPMQTMLYSHDRSGIEPVDAIGMGAMLIKSEVFRKLPQPWFQVVHSKAAQAFIGEDIYFCQLAKAHGVAVHVDHDASKLVRHIGSFEFSHDHVAACMENEDAGEDERPEEGRQGHEGIQGWDPA